jgi:Tfp pilus assembly protein PilF
MRAVVQWITLLTLAACAAATLGPSVRQARKDVEQGHPEAAVAKLESLRERSPRSFDVRLELGVAYYKLSRKALDEDRQEDYTRHLAKSLDEVLEAARIDPESPSPHTWMGIISAYQDDLESALGSFKNARKLAPRMPVHHLNIAQIYVYMGELGRARHSVEKSRRLGARGAFVLVEARDLFEQAYALDPEEVNTWDEAPVDKPIESFHDFTTYCCSNHTCGPHMGKACERMQLAVKERQLRDETLRQELVIEMERRRKLQEIYEGRRDLQIEIEPASEPVTSGQRP